MTIIQAVPTKRQFYFLPQELIRFSLPYRPSNLQEWVRVNGDEEYTVIPGRIIDAKTGEIKTLLPSGKIARLILLWICTQAKITQQRTITLQPSMRSFLSELGVPWSQKNAHEVSNQLQALIACKLQITTAKKANGERGVGLRNILIADEASLWFVYGNDGSKENSHITLAEAFYEGLPKAVPLDREKVTYLNRSSKSALTLDIYFWLCLRLYGEKKPSRVSWNQLHQQFGSQAALKKFKLTFRQSLEQAREMYPNSRIVEVQTGKTRKDFSGFLLYPSPDPRNSNHSP